MTFFQGMVLVGGAVFGITVLVIVGYIVMDAIKQGDWVSLGLLFGGGLVVAGMVGGILTSHA